MNGYIKDNFVYLYTSKNGSSTHSNFLAKHGWQYTMLTDDKLDIDLSKCVIFGHVSDPFDRHTKGVAEYIRLHPGIDIDHPDVAKLLVSGVYDAHTYTLTMIYASILHLDITWIPLDHKITNYLTEPHKLMIADDLTNDFFQEHNLDLKITSDYHRWRLADDPKEKAMRQKIVELKEKYHDDFLQMSGNIIEHDVLLYNKAIEKARKKYGSKI